MLQQSRRSHLTPGYPHCISSDEALLTQWMKPLRRAPGQPGTQTDTETVRTSLTLVKICALCKEEGFGPTLSLF